MTSEFVLFAFLLFTGSSHCVDWKSSLKSDTTDFGTVRQFCEYPVSTKSATTYLRVLPGASFDTLDCYRCNCSADGLYCKGVGVNGWTLSGPPECTVVADGCTPMFVLKSNRKLDCFTRRPVGSLPNGEKTYTVVGPRRSRTRPQWKSRLRMSQVWPLSSEYRADTTALRREAITPAESSKYQNPKPHSSGSRPFIANRVTRKWPVGMSSAYRQSRVVSYPSRFQTADRKVSKSEPMVTGSSDDTPELANPIAAMIAANSANYQVDRSVGLRPAVPTHPRRPGLLIMSRDTLRPNYSFWRKSRRSMVL